MFKIENFIMIPKPMPPYFVVRIEKEQQKNKKEKIGSLYFPTQFTFMQRGLQNGEIVAIGSLAHKEFPQAKIGDTLIVHHFLEGKKDEKGYEKFLIHTDATYKYYVVTAVDHNGQKNMTYGVWDGEKITTHKEYILLEKDRPVDTISIDEHIDKTTIKSSGGLLIFKEWNTSRLQMEERMKELQNQVKELSKSTMTDSVKKGIEEKEAEMNKISQVINSKRYTPYTIAAFNPELHEWFDTEIEVGETIYMQNNACNTTVEIFGKEYIIAKTDYIGCMFREPVYA